MPGLMSLVGWVCPGEGCVFLGMSMSREWGTHPPPPIPNCAWLHRVVIYSQKCFVTLASLRTGRSEIRQQNLKHNSFQPIQNKHELQAAWDWTQCCQLQRTLNYRPQRSCGKVVFSQASVSHSVHSGGVCLSACWDTPPRQVHPSQAGTPPGQIHPSRQVQPPPPTTVTAADGTHPTGMLSCLEVTKLHRFVLMTCKLFFFIIILETIAYVGLLQVVLPMMYFLMEVMK